MQRPRYLSAKACPQIVFEALCPRRNAHLARLEPIEAALAFSRDEGGIRSGVIDMSTIAPASSSITKPHSKEPWNKGRLIGQKPPLKLKEIWAIRVRLQIMNKVRDLAMFNLAIDSKLRSCDLVALRVDGISFGGRVRPRAVIIQKKTKRPVQFELTEQTRDSVAAWIQKAARRSGDCLFPSRRRGGQSINTRQ
jgi:hypothetical protein